MFTRNQLAHAVIWPLSGESKIHLVDPEGECLNEIKVLEPLKGFELAKMIPQGYWLDTRECHVVNMTGKLVVKTEVPFDTAVVTERAEVTFEERMQRLERRQKRSEKRQEKLLLEKEALEHQLAELNAVTEPEEELEALPDATDEPQDAPEGGKEEVSEGGKADA